MSHVLASNAAFLLVLVLASLSFHDTKGEWVETTKLHDADPSFDGLFGTAVAIDNGILAVGASGDKIGGYTFAGSVTVFELSDDDWIVKQKLTSPTPQNFETFGRVVAVSNEVVAVGSRYTAGGFRIGAVYTYAKAADGLWTLQQQLVPVDPPTRRGYGDNLSLALQGNTMIVGDPGDDSQTGAVHVYTLLANIWTKAAKLTAIDGADGDEFGKAVAIDGDTLVVGASDDDSVGSVYLFQRDGGDGSWAQIAKLTPGDGEVVDLFGYKVAVEGNTVAAASYTYGDIPDGAVYLFGKEGDTWTQQSKLVGYDRFGLDIEFYDGTLVVGGQGSDNGEVSLFTMDRGMWSKQGTLVADDFESSDWFGSNVAVDDGVIMVGASGRFLKSGSVYVFERRGSPSDGRGPIRRLLCTVFFFLCRD